MRNGKIFESSEAERQNTLYDEKVKMSRAKCLPFGYTYLVLRTPKVC